MEKDEILPAQMETERVSIESVMNSRFFEWGFEDVRAARRRPSRCRPARRGGSAQDEEGLAGGPAAARNAAEPDPRPVGAGRQGRSTSSRSGTARSKPTSCASWIQELTSTR